MGPVHKVHFILRFDIDQKQWEDNKAALMSELQSKLESSNVEINPLFRRSNAHGHKPNPIRRGDHATTPTTGQALTHCQTQLNEAIALYQQCLASGPLTNAAAVPMPTLFLSMLCRSHWSITIDFKVGNNGIRT